MERKEFHVLASIYEVEDIISKYIELKPLGTETIPLSEALGRIVSRDIYAGIDHPPFDRSTVDGYAVRSVDVAGADDLHPVKLRVIGRVEPGEKPSVEVEPGTAVEIATGAMIPRGADSVVMVEYTKKQGEREILVYRATIPGENISVAGSDISMGDLVIPRGTMLSEKEIGLLAGLGYDRVEVYRKPRIAVFSTGNEVVEPGDELVEGKVYNVNGYLVTSMLRSIGAEPVYLGLLRDDYSEMYSRIKDALEKYDLVITSGGTSAGLGDLVYRVFNDLGEPGVVIHGLKIKPGKPTVFAVVNGKLLIGLPGFPLSCYMVSNNIVKPLISRITGYVIPETVRVKARIPYQLRKPLGKAWFIPVALVETGNGYTAYPVSMRSGSISPLAYADGYMILPEDRDLVFMDEEVIVELFRDKSKIPRLNIIGSNDYALYRIIEAINMANNARIISVGSTAGWRAVQRGEADIAPTHLLDPETGEYNKPYVEKYGLTGKAVLFRGYERRIGIVVAPGNPKNIRSIRDFLRQDVVIVNRTRGSGIRVYLDQQLKSIAEEENVKFEDLVKKINGYFYEVKTHTAVAAAVKHGRADAGVAAEIAARLYDLEFIPLTWEKYDFLVPRDRMSKRHVSFFIEALRDTSIRSLINSIPGYRAHENTGYPY